MKGLPKELDTPLTISDLLMFHDTVYPFFTDKWDVIERNEGRLMAKNWTSSQEKKIEGQDRIPFSMPINAMYIQRISGTQRKSRQGWKVEAMNSLDAEVTAELGTLVLQDYEKKNQMKNLESEVFDDAIGKSFGGDRFRVDYSKGVPRILNEKVDLKNIVWDINDTSYSLEKVQFVAEIERKYRYELEDEYNTYLSDSNGSLEGREKLSYYVGGDADDLDYQIISVFHHYQRVKKKRYLLTFKDSANLFNFGRIVVKKFKSRQEATKLMRQLEFAYAAMSIPFENEAEIQEKDEFLYDYYKFTYNQILEFEETDLEFHPYNFYFAIKVADDWVSLMDIMSSPQVFIDRLYQQMDYSMRKELKNVLEMNVSTLAEGETAESAMRKASTTGGVIQKVGGERIIDVVESRGFNPQYLQVIGLLGQMVADITGGNNANGMKESANESGKAVQLRQAQGKMSSFYFLDNFERYKVAKGWKLLKLVQKFDNAKRVIKIAGSDLSEEMLSLLQENGIYSKSQTSKHGYVKINDPENKLTFLENADLELVIETAPLTDYEKSYKLSQMLEAEKYDPTLVQISGWQSHKLELMDLPKSLVQDIKKERIQIQQQQAQFQQQQFDLEKAKVLASIKDEKKDSSKKDSSKKDEDSK